MSSITDSSQQHSPAWVAQTWISFVLSFGMTLMCVYFMPADLWVKACLGMGLFFTVGSTFSLSKTVRDQHEAERLHKRIDEARVHRIIAEHDPLKPAV